MVGAGSFKAAYNLGLWYEVSGNGEKAAEYYRQSALAGFEPAARRLKENVCENEPVMHPVWFFVQTINFFL